VNTAHCKVLRIALYDFKIRSRATSLKKDENVLGLLSGENMLREVLS